MPLSPLTDDRVFRYVFGEPEGLPLLESLINAYFEAVGLPLVHQLELIPRELGPERLGEKTSAVDVAARDETGRTVTIEVQTSRKPAFFERVLFYWARLYGRQLPAGNQYDVLRPVLSVSFLEYAFSDGPAWLHFHRLPLTDHLGFIFVELTKLTGTAAVADGLKRAAVWGKFLEYPEAAAPVADTPALDATRRRLEEFMAITPEIWNEVRREIAEHDLATLRHEARKEGLAEGRVEGRVEGRAEGIAEGKAEGRAEGMVAGRAEGRLEVRTEVARRMLETRMPPAQVALLTGLTEAEVEALAGTGPLSKA